MAGELDRVKDEFQETKARITSLKTSLEANKAELTNIGQYHTEADDIEKNLKRSLDATMSLNVT